MIAQRVECMIESADPVLRTIAVRWGAVMKGLQTRRNQADVAETLEPEGTVMPIRSDERLLLELTERDPNASPEDRSEWTERCRDERSRLRYGLGHA